ncbi:hypothetical protein THRCLA_04505 [Thraustotheca clavata]|uniref:Helicase-associated domain-containing protein n=1 Tax=Thraustotheca clavata TaxID=74557 RepID=A0A1V9ZYW3_9STRA|nr:hypothetical protein THRCLA_04505 [Thraustotheca clavata]
MEVIELLSSDEEDTKRREQDKIKKKRKKRRDEDGDGDGERKRKKRKKKKKKKKKDKRKDVIEIIEISSSDDEKEEKAACVVGNKKKNDEEDDGGEKTGQVLMATPCLPLEQVYTSKLQTQESELQPDEDENVGIDDQGLDGEVSNVVYEESPLIRIDLLFPELSTNVAPIPDSIAALQSSEESNSLLEPSTLTQATPLEAEALQNNPLETPALSNTTLESSTLSYSALESPASLNVSSEVSAIASALMESTVSNSPESRTNEPQNTLQAMCNAFQIANSVQVARDVSPEAENDSLSCLSDQSSKKKDKEDDPMLDVAPTLTFDDENEMLPEDYIQNRPQPLADYIELEHGASEESTPEPTEPNEELMRLPDLGEDIASVISMIEHREELAKTIGQVDVEAAVGINPKHIEDINFDVRDLVLPKSKPVVEKKQKPLPPRTPKSFARVFNRGKNNEPIPSRRARYDLHMTNGRPLPPNLQEDYSPDRRRSSRSERRKRRQCPEVIDLLSSSEEEFEAELAYTLSDSRPEPQVRSKVQTKSSKRQNIIIMDDSDSDKGSSNPVRPSKKIEIKLPIDGMPRARHKPTSSYPVISKPKISQPNNTKPANTKQPTAKPLDDSAIRANRFNISRPTQRSPEDNEPEILRHPTTAERHKIFINVVKVTYQQQRHKSVYTNLPHEFVVPSEAPWPEMLWGTFVDVKAFREAHKSGLLSLETIAELDKLRFVWDPSLHQWHVQITAFQTYKALYGDLCIPHNFEIPDKDKRWPKDVWKVALGILAHNLRHKSSALTPVRKQQLSALGFIWEMEELQWRIWYKALLTYYYLNGHVDVPLDFVVPENDQAWTPDSWNEKLGEIVAGIRSEAKSISAARKWQLDELGFFWGHGIKTKKRKRHLVPQRLPRSGATVDKACLGAYSAPHFPMFGEKPESTARWDDYGEVIYYDPTEKSLTLY